MTGNENSGNGVDSRGMESRGQVGGGGQTNGLSRCSKDSGGAMADDPLQRSPVPIISRRHTIGQAHNGGENEEEDEEAAEEAAEEPEEECGNYGATKLNDNKRPFTSLRRLAWRKDGRRGGW